MTSGVEVRDARGCLFRFENAQSYKREVGHGGVVVELYSEPDCRGQFLGLFTNPCSVLPVGVAS